MEIRTLGPAFPGTRKFLRSFNRDVLLEVCFERSIERILDSNSSIRTLFPNDKT